MCCLDLHLFAADCHQVSIINPDWWPQGLQSRIPMGPSAFKRFIFFGFSWSTKLSCKSTRSTKNTAGSRSTPALEKMHPLGLTGPYIRQSRLLQNSNMQQREEQRQRENPTIANTNTYTTNIVFILWHFAMTIIQVHPEFSPLRCSARATRGSALPDLSDCAGCGSAGRFAGGSRLSSNGLRQVEVT